MKDEKVSAHMNRDHPWIRLIPVLILKNGLLVRSQSFSTYQIIGNPMSTVARFNDWQVDELIVLDISENNVHDLRRDDLFQSYEGASIDHVLRAIADTCQMPLTFGGGLKTIADIEQRLALGADKVTINSAAIEDSSLITEAAKRFGQQCIVVSIDALELPDKQHRVAFRGHRGVMEFEPREWAHRAQELGAGEILLNSIDRDGSGRGYDLDLAQSVSSNITIPLILLGGVGEFPQFAPGVIAGGANALAAANIFHFRELSYIYAKKSCIEAGLPLRPPDLSPKLLGREPYYDLAKTLGSIESRKKRAESQGSVLSSESPLKLPSVSQVSVKWCQKCVYPSSAAVPLDFNAEGVCTGCQVAEVKKRFTDISWNLKETELKSLILEGQLNNSSGYDCVIAVSGGKDSYYQTHVLKSKYGLNPLLVTYDGNNWTEVGWQNLLRMREVFNVDHLIIRPQVSVLKKLNRLGFLVMGDMNWHAHVGIMTVPMATAVRYQIPLVFYGEHGYLDLSGQFSPQDVPEVTYRDRLEHFARGFEWNYFVGLDGLSEKDLLTWRYPSDNDIYELNLRGIFLGNYVQWDANAHIEQMVKLYGFKISEAEFDRTYRRMSNLDDMHENGVHDYLKYIKFGYGRATDHASKDIRAGLMSREEAISLINRYDPVKPKDLKRWLNYVGMTESEFDAWADTFRDPRVWTLVDGSWRRDLLTQ